ncbi:amino acid ABC transporter permease [Agromyces cerinus]|uniref:Amino acid ABC transporter membrane protein 2, PAAT family n=1 Tax=Agromyces cerinus subsp. cerinus TaxID=232089 RepID=A0A1N6H5U1_9MICO|nr:amino acid ABC transporter permease [Agromyces cerinus]SIO15102.1 amino acid ABC transporter membrane protein 2, PAAT family [Agromyces cerinus subsp. cerinus]
MSHSSVLFDAPGPKARRASLISSIVTGVVIVGGLAWMVWTLAQPRESGGIILPGFFDASRWNIFADPEVWQFIIFDGVLGTLRAALTAAVFAIAIGVLFSLLRSSEHAWIRVPTSVVLEFLRGMPVLLMMLFILLVLDTGSFWAVVIALSLYNGAIIGEALRAGLAALPRGQREAGLSLGMRPLQSKMLVEFPQAFRQMLPIIVAQLVVLLKDTSLGFIVGYTELLRVNMNYLASFYGNRYLFSLFVVTLVLYLIMNLSLSWFARWLSKRTASKSSGARLDPDNPNQAILMAEATAAARKSEDNSPR